MIYVVTNVFVGGSCPKFLQPVGTEMRKTNHHAFESEEHLSRYLTGLEQWVKELGAPRINYLGFSHTSDETGGEVTIFRTRGGYGDLMRMKYIRLCGHVMVGKDSRTVYPQEFIEEGETE